MQPNVSPVLSAQLMTAPTGRPREIRNFAPEDPPRPVGRRNSKGHTVQSWFRIPFTFSNYKFIHIYFRKRYIIDSLSRTPLTPSPCATQFSCQTAIPHYYHPYVELKGPGRLNPRSNFCSTAFFLQSGNRTSPAPVQLPPHYCSARRGAILRCSI